MLSLHTLSIAVCIGVTARAQVEFGSVGAVVSNPAPKTSGTVNSIATAGESAAAKWPALLQPSFASATRFRAASRGSVIISTHFWSGETLAS